MAVPIIFLVIIFLLFLPSHSLTGPNPVSCGGIDIKDPFSTNARATYPIQCNGSAPTVQFGGVTYPVMNISYQEKVVTIYDQVLSHYLADLNCSFLYNFIVPVHHFNPSSDIFGRLAHKTNLPSGSPNLKSPKPRNCVLEDFLFLTGFFYLSYNFSACENYNIYFETKNELLTAIPPSCSVSQPSSFEWILSFSEYDGSFSLLSAGFSRKTKLRTDCFNCQVKRNCRGNGDGRDSFCKCEHEPGCLGSKSKSK